MFQTIAEFLFVLLLLIGVPVGLVVGTLGFMAILLFFVSIPIVLCHWAYELFKAGIR
jgi:hypothetical protein